MKNIVVVEIFNACLYIKPVQSLETILVHILKSLLGIDLGNAWLEATGSTYTKGRMRSVMIATRFQAEALGAKSSNGRRRTQAACLFYCMQT